MLILLKIILPLHAYNLMAALAGPVALQIGRGGQRPGGCKPVPFQVEIRRRAAGLHLRLGCVRV